MPACGLLTRDGVRSWECAPPGLSRVSACPSQCGSGQLEVPEVTGRQWAGLAGGAVPGRRGQARESRGWRGADLAGPGPCPAFRPPGDPISRIQRNLCGLHFLRGLRRERSLECPQGRAEGRCRRPLQGPQPQAPFSAHVSPSLPHRTHLQLLSPLHTLPLTPPFAGVLPSPFGPSYGDQMAACHLAHMLGASL